MENVATVVVMSEVVQQLYSLKQVVWKMHGYVYGGEGVQQARGTPEDSQYSEGCEFGGDFQDIVIY